MRFDFVGLAVFEIKLAAIALVSGNAGREVLVHVRQPFVIGFPIFVFFGVGIGIALSPPFKDELLAFIVAVQNLPCFQIVGRKNRFDLTKPVFKSLVRFLLYLARFVRWILGR